MAQTFASGVVLKNAVEAVTVPLEDGLHSVSEIYMKLIEAQVDPLTGQCSNYDDIRNQIVLAKQKLEQSEQAAGTGLGSLDAGIENLEKDVGAEGGWFPISFMIRTDGFDSQVEQSRSRASKDKVGLTHTEQSIPQKHDQADKIRKEIQKVREQREAVAELQMKVRNIIHILGLLSGKASEGKTHTFIKQEAVMKLMDDLTNSAEELLQNQLLFNEGIPKLIYEMREQNQKLAAICASSKK